MPNRPFPFTDGRASIAAVPTTESEFTAAVGRHHAELHRHCTRLLGSHADAEDALQETLLRAWRSRRTLEARSPRGWLYAIATNACFDVMARRDTTLVSLDDHDAAAPPEHEPDAELLARETVELALLTAIQELPERQHASFVMCDLLRFPARDVAAVFSTSVPATNSCLQRARRGLRARLGASRLEWSCGAPAPAQRRTLRDYLAALEVR
jgi:RNA polymerase sigma-70 factor (ECF subfamily)